MSEEDKNGRDTYDPVAEGWKRDRDKTIADGYQRKRRIARKVRRPRGKRGPKRKRIRTDVAVPADVVIDSPMDPSWWRSPWHPAFIAALRKAGGNPSVAARAIGMAGSTVRTARKRCAKFRQAWDDVITGMVDELEATWLHRAVHGWREPVYYQGELVGWKRKYSERAFLAFMAAKRPEEWRARPLESVRAIDPDELAHDLRQALARMDDATPLVEAAAAHLADPAFEPESEDVELDGSEGTPIPGAGLDEVDDPAGPREPEYEVLTQEQMDQLSSDIAAMEPPSDD